VHHHTVYPPLDTLKPVAPDVWIVDSGPMRALGLEIPLRMSVVRLADGGMWLHSPTPLADNLRREIEGQGPIRHLVAPNIAHWMFLKDWKAACPDATSWAAPGLRQRSQVKKSGVVLDRDLTATAPPEWADEIDQAVVPGGFGVNEVGFFHRATRTLFLTDLVQNFEPEKVQPLARPLLQATGSMAPDGKAPFHLRLAINARRDAAAAVVRQMIAWGPERVIFTHGRWFENNGTEELRRSFRWLTR
jgi:hypothetical protein